MKKAFSILALSMLCFTSCVDKTKYEESHSSGGRVIYTETFQGHSIWVANEKLTHDPECPKCKEILKQTITEVVDSIVDYKVTELLGK